MRLKGIVITVCACILLIATGTVGFSFLYQIFFHPEMIIEDSSVNLTGWQKDQAQFEKEMLYPFPFLLESETIVETGENSLLSDFYYINQEEYLSALKLADLDWADLENAVITEYEFQTDTVEYKEYGLRYLFHITLIQNDRSNDVILAVDKEHMPVWFQYGSTNKMDNADNRVTPTSMVALDELPTELCDYLAQIDMLLGSQKSYRSLLIAIETNFPSKGELPTGSLTEYCQYGEWKIYSDLSTAAYVCIINDSNFILYYDLESGNFCGYNIALNHSE